MRLVEQRHLLQIARVEPFRKSPVKLEQAVRELAAVCLESARDERKLTRLACWADATARSPHALALARFDTASCQRVK
jgi:hypothetical protein